MRYRIFPFLLAAFCCISASSVLAQTNNCDGITVKTGVSPLCLKPGAGATKGQSFRDCPDCPEMVVVPAGSFLMGSPDNEIGTSEGIDIDHYTVDCNKEKTGRVECRNEAEEPQHKVSIPKPYAVGKFAITFDEWDACMADGGCNTKKPRDEGWGRGRRPVIFISWTAARDYVKWLSKKTGHIYRLPSEAEWEYAARAGTTTPYWLGERITTDRANFNKDEGSNSQPVYLGEPAGTYRAQTLPVDAFQPNPWGLYQVHGNVLEWVEDCYHDNYKNKPEELKNTGGAWKVGICTSRVLRGGAYGNSRYDNRSASRHRDYYRRVVSNNGFRVVRELP